MIIYMHGLMQSDHSVVGDPPPTYVATISDGIITATTDLNNQPIQTDR